MKVKEKEKTNIIAMISSRHEVVKQSNKKEYFKYFKRPWLCMKSYFG